MSHIGLPPSFQLSPSQVSLPNSPGPGTAYHRHSRLPVADVVGVEESARAEFAAGDADEHLVFHDERRARQAVAEHRVRDLCFPERQSGSGVERDQRGVERADEQPVAEQRRRRG